MSYIDSAILSVTEWLCRKFQLLTGRSNVWLALQLTNLSIVVYFVWAGVVFWRDSWTSRILLTVFCIGLLYVLTQTIFKEPIEGYEKNAYRRVAQGYRNPRRVRDAPLRISFLNLSLVPPLVYVFLQQYPALLAELQRQLPVRGILLTYSLIVLTTVVLYVLACDPLPPCAGKVTVWLRGLSRQRVTAAPESTVSPADRG